MDPSRDLNGAGLLYFASYFSIVDRALLLAWRGLGRDDRSFLDRVVVDQQLCYLGNADAGSPLILTVRQWLRAGDAGSEAFDVVLRDKGTGRLLAVCSLQLETGTSE
nr:LnmK family bifunctional acyltransferase/decarboxylase [Streptomyces sp. 1331.2]